ncbi:hypothetical protein D3C81_1313590 [compost metagenome]
MNHNGQDKELEDKLIHELLMDLQTLDRVVPEKNGPSVQSWELIVRERWSMTAWLRRWEVVLFCLVALLMISGTFLFALTTPVFYALMQGIGVIAAVAVLVALRLSQKGRIE